MHLALYQPDIPQNTGAILRLSACLDVDVHIIEPSGFDVSDRALRRAGLDYIEHTRITRHASFEVFERWRRGTGQRLVLLTTQAGTPYTDLSYLADDILLLGRESAGVPEDVHSSADARILVPMAQGRRSLNLVTAAAMVLGEALRQTDGFPSN
jgi:tRNA (cytidine/uridine-2'-O-)-methyltransferase